MIIRLLLVAASYGLFRTLYDLYQLVRAEPVSGDRPDFLPPPEGANVRAPKNPPLGGLSAEARVEFEGSAVSQVP
jgi:hypothetical protein